AHRGRQVPVSRVPFLIGRASNCHLRPSSPAVGSRHCALLHRNGGLLLTDLGSTNGTFLNGVRLVGSAAFGAGDEFAVGPLRFRLRVEMPSPRAETSVEEAAARTLLASEAARDLPVTLSAPLTPLKDVPMRRSSPAAAARGILEMMRRDEKQG